MQNDGVRGAIKYYGQEVITLISIGGDFMIPKIIHYVWFGGNEKPKSVLNDIETWRTNLPDYEICEWNELNYELTENSPKYVQQAFKEKSWAFVSDYVRLDVLNQFGGIYLDTDVELLKGFDDLLDLKSFIGLESDYALSTAVIGSEAHQTWTEMAIKDYQTRSFFNDAGRKDKTPNSLYLFELLGGKSSKYFDRVFPATFFSPISFTTGAVNITSETVAVHHFSGTWKNRRSKIKDLIMRRIAKLLGESTFERVRKYLKSISAKK
ncbi:glycosyltransferase family 32 protein [Weissella confusa]|uniref:glycosyltransferase family 32 protein n=1 Tax=Weissella confusa TaxID=1583 RepID=UPI0021AF8BDA|nr:glycosyltransferase [Weissella confusa]